MSPELELYTSLCLVPDVCVWISRIKMSISITSRSEPSHREPSPFRFLRDPGRSIVPVFFVYVRVFFLYLALPSKGALGPKCSGAKEIQPVSNASLLLLFCYSSGP